MQISKTEAEENRVIAHYSRVWYTLHMRARLVRRTTQKGAIERTEAADQEKDAVFKLIGIIDSIDKPRGARS